MFLARSGPENGVPDTAGGVEFVRIVYDTFDHQVIILLFTRNVGIGVDVHVHRITNRLGWHKPPTKNPEETRYVTTMQLHPRGGLNHSQPD